MAQVPDMTFKIEEKPIKWEYKTLWLYNEDDEEELNKLGDDRWELVSIIVLEDNSVPLAYFKRPIWSAK